MSPTSPVCSHRPQGSGSDSVVSWKQWLPHCALLLALTVSCAPLAGPTAGGAEETREPLVTETVVRTAPPPSRVTEPPAAPSPTVEVALPTVTSTAEVGAAVATPDIGNAAELDDLIRVTAPQPGQVAGSPLVVRGEARGMWFFEASFPIRLEDSAGHVLASGIATALGEWMTEEFVPFEATLTFTVPPGEVAGRLVLERDNPSGLPEHDAELLVPVRLNAP